MQPNASTITLNPRALPVYTLQTAEVIVEDQGNIEKFTTKGSKKCHGLVTWSPQKGTTRQFHVKVKAGVKKGACFIIFADSDHHMARLAVRVKQEPTFATFGYIGYPQNFTVPGGVSSLTIGAHGAQGGYAGGGAARAAASVGR